MIIKISGLSKNINHWDNSHHRRQPHFRKSVLNVLAATGAAGFSMSTYAQSCSISVGYQALASTSISPVPSLGTLSLAALAAGLGILAWRKRRMLGQDGGVRKLLPVVLLASAGILGIQGGDGLIQSVRAAGPYEFSDANGGTVEDAEIVYEEPSPVVTITNTSGKRIKISNNANPEETGTCAVGTVIEPGASCTTQAICGGVL